MAKSTVATKRDIYQDVTDRIIEQLEAGTAPWVRSWQSTSINQMPHNAKTGRPYNGVNVLMCWATQMQKGYTSNAWLTFKQAKELGGSVRKGEKGTTVVFWKFLKKTEQQPSGEDKAVTIPMARAYTVFNVEQCDGLKLPKRETAEEQLSDHERHEAAEHIIDLSGAEVVLNGDKPCYVPAFDRVHMPELGAFNTAEDFYATHLHELTHWTGHRSRCDRDLTGRFGTESYAAEELIAELGAAFLCAELGIECKLQHASYIDSWLRVLKQDKRAIFTAASMATKAATFLKEKAGMVELERRAA